MYQEKVEINAFSIYETFKEFGTINKVVVFKKKNYQIFIEFEMTKDALKFKQTLHNQNFKGFFYLKI